MNIFMQGQKNYLNQILNSARGRAGIKRNQGIDNGSGGAILLKVIRECLSEKEHISRNPKEWREAVVKLSGGKLFQATGTASTKAQRWDHVWCVNRKPKDQSAGTEQVKGVLDNEKQRQGIHALQAASKSPSKALWAIIKTLHFPFFTSFV